MVDKIKYEGYKAFTNIAASFMGTLKESKFLEKGVLTPEEFVMAGEHLTHKCNTWKWMPGKDNHANKNLPRDKQYLVTTGVPCEKRIKDLQRLYEAGGSDLEKDVEDGWVETTNPEKNVDKEEECMDIDNLDGEDQKMQVINEAKAADDGDGSDGFDLDAMSDDENMFATPATTQQEEEKKGEEKANNANIIRKARKYDLSITYDFYTQTPRLWLTGFSEGGQPLTQKEIFEDIAADYAKKTVTMESHPHSGVKQASIHPCNHAKVMKTIIDTIVANGGEPQVTQCLFVFLKFISSVVPTI